MPLLAMGDILVGIALVCVGTALLIRVPPAGPWPQASPSTRRASAAAGPPRTGTLTASTPSGLPRDNTLQQPMVARPSPGRHHAQQGREHTGPATVQGHPPG